MSQLNPNSLFIVKKHALLKKEKKKLITKLASSVKTPHDHQEALLCSFLVLDN